IVPDDEDPDLSNIGYKLLRAPYCSDKNNTWLHWSPSYERPYSFIIDEYLLFFYFNRSYLNGMVLNFYGSEKQKQKANFNTPFKGESIFGISENTYKRISDNIVLFCAQLKLGSIGRMLDLSHQKLGGTGKEMYPPLKNEILKRLASSNVELGKKHNIENLNKIITDTIIELK